MKNKKLKGKRMKEEPKLRGISVKRKLNKEKKQKKNRKPKNIKEIALNVLTFIGLIILVPIAFIFDTIIFILKLLKKLIISLFKLIKNHLKIVKKILIVLILLVAIKFAYTYLENINNKIDDINSTITIMVDKDVKMQENINILSEQLNTNTQELESKNKEIEEKQKQINNLQSEVNKLKTTTTSRGGITSRSSSSVSVATGSKAEYQSYAKDLCINTYGWIENDFNCLVKLWERESNWNPNAVNKSSGATGIPQALPGSKMASEGSDWATNAKTQIRWGLKYIKNRYGTPSAAWAHSQQKGWY